MKTKFRIIFFLVLIGFTKNDYCKKALMNSYFLEGLLEPNDSRIPICSSITNNCCTEKDLIKIFDLRNTILLPKLADYKNKFKQSLSILETLHNDALKLPETENWIEDQTEYCKNTRSEFTNFNFRRLMRDLRSGIETTADMFLKIHESYLCVFCDFDAQSSILVETMQLAQDSHVCFHVLTENTQFMTLIHNRLIQYYETLQHFLDCSYFDKSFEFPFIFGKQKNQQNDWKECEKTLSTGSLSEQCESFCNDLKLGAVSPVFEGDVFFMNHANNHYDSIVKLIRIKHERASFDPFKAIEVLNGDRTGVRFFDVPAKNEDLLNSFNANLTARVDEQENDNVFRNQIGRYSHRLGSGAIPRLDSRVQTEIQNAMRYQINVRNGVSGDIPSINLPPLSAVLRFLSLSSTSSDDQDDFSTLGDIDDQILNPTTSETLNTSPDINNIVARSARLDTNPSTKTANQNLIPTSNLTFSSKNGISSAINELSPENVSKISEKTDNLFDESSIQKQKMRKLFSVPLLLDNNQFQCLKSFKKDPTGRKILKITKGIPIGAIDFPSDQQLKIDSQTPRFLKRLILRLPNKSLKILMVDNKGKPFSVNDFEQKHLDSDILLHSIDQPLQNFLVDYYKDPDEFNPNPRFNKKSRKNRLMEKQKIDFVDFTPKMTKIKAKVKAKSKKSLKLKKRKLEKNEENEEKKQIKKIESSKSKKNRKLSKISLKKIDFRQKKRKLKLLKRFSKIKHRKLILQKLKAKKSKNHQKKLLKQKKARFLKNSEENSLIKKVTNMIHEQFNKKKQNQPKVKKSHPRNLKAIEKLEKILENDFELKPHHSSLGRILSAENTDNRKLIETDPAQYYANVYESVEFYFNNTSPEIFKKVHNPFDIPYFTAKIVFNQGINSDKYVEGLNMDIQTYQLELLVKGNVNFDPLDQTMIELIKLKPHELITQALIIMTNDFSTAVIHEFESEDDALLSNLTPNYNKIESFQVIEKEFFNEEFIHYNQIYVPDAFIKTKKLNRKLLMDKKMSTKISQMIKKQQHIRRDLTNTLFKKKIEI